MRKKRIYFALFIIFSAFIITSILSFQDGSNKTKKIENIPFFFSEGIFDVIPVIVLHYNIPSDPKSGLKLIEGLDPKTNSRIFSLEFDILSHNKNKIRTQRFYSPSGILLLRSRLKDGKINFQFDFLGDKNISIRDTKISWKKSKFEIFLEGKRMVNIILQYNKDGRVEISSKSKENGIKQLITLFKKIRGSTFEKQLKEFTWAHSFMPENDSTYAAIFAGSLTGIVSIPDQLSINTRNQSDDSPFWDYVECLEASCSDCGGYWVISPITGCVWEWDPLGIYSACYAIQAIICAKEFLQL
ncbi:hypothetical protein NLB96_01535 [Candidatus Aminicenantes bacterium AC-335-K20]|nr:hypothetical protein [SCandidatus Aminicenantes bacterium Aminicenantia_JdfR_composite]MCP2597567.1 hypothetical protein [Candidatus Aminicenantes bacterium AC-335-G13]MCP2619437.1 hypothetical protein [Candidatus Aminicenantes bacterium AC-335-K20]